MRESPQATRQIPSKKYMIQRPPLAVQCVLLAAMLSCLGCASVPPAAPTPPPPTSAAAGATTIVAVAPPASPGMTLPKFLGLDVLFGGARQLGQRIRNRLGSRFPGLESKPPVKSITDPSNMGPDASPAEKAAAEAKAEEDKAPQKAKAIRYLASRGCGECYPDTENALISAMEDCNESIRYEAVRGLRGSAGKCCNSCQENSCCTPKLLNKLYELAYERDDAGCFVESSARVRRNARLVICECGGVPPLESSDVPSEGPPMPAPVPAPAIEATVRTKASKQGEPVVAQQDVNSQPSVDLASNTSSESGDKNDSEVKQLGKANATDASKNVTAGFVLPDSFELAPETDEEALRRD